VIFYGYIEIHRKAQQAIASAQETAIRLNHQQLDGETFITPC
jgi:hypothetical protein